MRHTILHYLLRHRPVAWLAIAVLLATIIIIVDVYMVHNITTSSVEQHPQMEPKFASSVTTRTTPILWIYHKTERPLGHVMTVFSRLGYTLGGPGEDWDVLWSHEYPFKSLPPDTLRNLKPQRKINHFPGSGCFTFKPQLATLDFPFIPKAFKLPQQAEKLKDEATAHPEKHWVHKSNMHRGIKVKNIDGIDLNTAGSFVQEFISNPLLIDGRKFDLGIYTAITSVDPLRVYTYEEELLLRFCSKDYHPFHANDPKKYVVDDDYTPSWEVPSMAALTVNQKFSHKEALNMVLNRKGYDPARLWEQAKSAIRKVLVHCEPMMRNTTNRITSDSRHFFEIFRFDFVIDEDFNVWLMEVNLSPNLSSAHTYGNRFMYEQVLFNLLSLVGLARATDGSTRYNGEYESVMLVNDQDIQVPLEECAEGRCKDCSSLPICKLCQPCRRERDSFVLKTAFLEHVSRRNFRRVYPPPITEGLSRVYPPPITDQTEGLSQLTPANFLMNAWFRGKCKQDVSWCT